jgi:hypothetical protein
MENACMEHRFRLSDYSGTPPLKCFHKYHDGGESGYVQAFFPPPQAVLAGDPGLWETPA